MARKHVFPVCSTNFNALDLDTIDETQSYPALSTSNAYGGTTSSGAKFAIIVGSDSGVNFIIFFLEESGEYLLDENVSAPSDTTFDWTDSIIVNSYNVSLPNIEKVAPDRDWETK